MVLHNVLTIKQTNKNLCLPVSDTPAERLIQSPEGLDLIPV